MDLRSEIYRYLGYKKVILDEEIDHLIDECLYEIEDIKKPNFLYKLFNIEKKDNKIVIVGTNLIINSNSLCKFLRYSKEIAIIAVTIGVEIDRRINLYSKTNLTKSIVFNACANAIIEQECDNVQGIINKIAVGRNFYITNRFSPGYGDFDLKYQKDINRLLDASKKIGLTVTESYILIPRKSVTAIIGIQNKKSERLNVCEICNKKEECENRGRGNCEI